jgi:hypothetical protein
MEQRLSLITLGVADLGRAREFYQRLRWRGQEVEETVFFQAGTVGVVLWGRDLLRWVRGMLHGSGRARLGDRTQPRLHAGRDGALIIPDFDTGA